MKNNDVSHEGHRERLLNLIDNAGIENVSKIQAVEYFLTYIFPRGDVNPLAHRLLDRYGNFANIINASPVDLIKVKGINERSAKKITLFSQLIDLYAISSMEEKISIDDRDEFLDLMEQYLRFKPNENLVLYGFNSNFILTHTRKFTNKSIRDVAFSAFDLYDFIASAKPAYIAVAHNHPGGLATPSPNDADAMERIIATAENFDIKFIDSFIVGLDGILSHRQLGYVRRFHNVGDIMNYISSQESVE